MTRVPKLAGLAVGLALFAGACASADTLDQQVVLDLIPAAVSPEVASDVTGVSCPDKIPRGAGLVVRCSAKLGDDSVTVEAEQVDDEGTLKFTTLEPLVDVDDIETQASERLTTELVDSYVVDCGGPRYQVLVVERVLRCSAEAGDDEPREIDITILDEDANFGIELVS